MRGPRGFLAGLTTAPPARRTPPRERSSPSQSPAPGRGPAQAAGGTPGSFLPCPLRRPGTRYSEAGLALWLPAGEKDQPKFSVHIQTEHWGVGGGAEGLTSLHQTKVRKRRAGGRGGLAFPGAGRAVPLHPGPALGPPGRPSAQPRCLGVAVPDLPGPRKSQGPKDELRLLSSASPRGAVSFCPQSGTSAFVSPGLCK